MKTWSSKKISDSIEKLPKKRGVPRNKYQKEGIFPIIDQGQDFIGGYTSDESLVYKNGLPIIIFGDHTRAIKFVDFPFAVGADGTKVIKPRDFFYTKYFYLVLKSLTIESRGYARHFRVLKDKEIPLPPLPTQKKIVAKVEKLLAKIKEAKRLRAEAQASAQNLLPAALHKIFEEGKKKGWNFIEVEKCLEKNSGVSKGILTKEYNKSGKYPIIDQGQKFIAGFSDNERVLYKGKLPVIIFGDHTRILKYVDYPFILGADGTKILLPKNNIDVKYFYYILTGLQISTRGYARHFRILREQEIPLPPLGEQKKIVAYLDSLSAKVQQILTLQAQTAADLAALEQAVLRKAFAN